MPRQDSLTDQMRDVMRMAREAGCYDAEDWIRRAFYESRATWEALWAARPLDPISHLTFPG